MTAEHWLVPGHFGAPRWSGLAEGAEVWPLLCEGPSVGSGAGRHRDVQRAFTASRLPPLG